jgi:hypothetical protein
MFDALETSARGGRPVHLFIFTRQGVSWRYASGDRDVVLGTGTAARTYLAAPISRSEIKQTVEKAQDNITIAFPYVRDPNAFQVPVTQPLGDNWHPFIPSDPITVTCMAYHANDTDGQAVVEWMGEVAQPRFTDGKMQLTCQPVGAADRSKRQGPKFGRACWKTTYSVGLRGCNLVPADFQIGGTLSAVDGLVLTASAFATSAFSLAGASLSWTRADGVIESRPVMSHTLGSSSVTLLYGGAELAPGLAITALPECPKNWQACADRNNTDNYGGAIYKPVKNPYQGQSMTWG